MYYPLIAVSCDPWASAELQGWVSLSSICFCSCLTLGFYESVIYTSVFYTVPIVYSNHLGIDPDMYTFR